MKFFFGLVLLQTVVAFPGPIQVQGPLTLGAALQLFEQRNPRLQARRELVQVAEGRLQQAGTFPNPQLNFSQESLPLGAPDVSYGDQEFILWATQKLELGGKRKHRSNVAASQFEVTRAGLRDFLRLEKARLKEAFVDTFIGQQKMTLARQHLDAYYEIRDIHAERLKAGDVSGLSQLRIEMEEVRYLTVLNEAQRTLATSWSVLASLIDWSSPSRPALQLKIQTSPLERSLEMLSSDAMESRPDLLAAKLQSRQAEHVVDLERANRTPDVTVGGGYKRDFGVNSFYASASMPIPIFDRNTGNLSAAQADLRKNRNLELWKQMEIRFEVERAFNTYSNQQLAVSRLEGNLIERAERIVEVTSRSYRAGEAQLIDYLDALRSRLEASDGFYTLMLQLEQARIELEKVTGVGLR